MARTIDPFSGRVPGNVDLYAQPKVTNPDGSISTVDSSSYNLGGRETLLPSVTPDGRHLQTDDEIVNEYLRSGRHLGQFDTPEEASAYAERLHDDYARGRYDVRPTIIDPFTGSKGYQGRTFEEELRGPLTINPFDDRPAIANAPNLDYAMPAIVNVPIASVDRGLSMPRSRGPAPLVEAPVAASGARAGLTPVTLGPSGQGGAVYNVPRGRPIDEMVAGGKTFDAQEFAVREFQREQQLLAELEARRTMGERERAQTHFFPQRDARISGEAFSTPLGLAQPEAIHRQDMRKYHPEYGGAASPQLDPEQQAIVDSFWDEMDRWWVTDEAGNRYPTAQRSDFEPIGRGTQRAIADLEAMEIERALQIEAARQAARPAPRRMI